MDVVRRKDLQDGWKNHKNRFGFAYRLIYSCKDQNGLERLVINALSERGRHLERGDGQYPIRNRCQSCIKK